MPRILIADEQTLMREGLKMILDPEEDMEVVALAASGSEAYELVARHRPDVVLMDIRTSEADGMASTRKIKSDYPDTVVLFLTTSADDGNIVDGFASGASGFLLKDMQGVKFVNAVRDAAKGELMVPAVIAARLATKLSGLFASTHSELLANRWRSRGIALSERENQIAMLLVQGYNNRQIAKALNFSEGTVKNYISSIYGKIGVRDRPNAILVLQDKELRRSAVPNG